ncbi:hypothetical protein [Streptomyces sp. NBC_01264]|uniref:hypothetical protein n=1 Tax=Streptomyces sp. NBC_01264 TaxID=2903804 RepID=UPI00225725FF|nr:hypothetical protein [Streptomyces sp. NBC_01264]MCX4780067.1 hypothetical protein [Streptomyces sp. NBC_01264]
MTGAPLERTARLSLNSRGGTVEIAGHNVSHAVRGLRLEQTAAGGPPRITLDIVVWEAEVDGEATVTVPQPTAELLVSLGWVPPQTPPLTAQTIQEAAHRKAAQTALRIAAQHNPGWFSDLIRREARLNGTATA